MYNGKFKIIEYNLLKYYTQAFTAEFNSSQVYVTPHTPHQKVASSSISIGPLTVSVYQGDITQERSDAIVNNTDNSFDLSRGTLLKKKKLDCNCQYTLGELELGIVVYQ